MEAHMKKAKKSKRLTMLLALASVIVIIGIVILCVACSKIKTLPNNYKLEQTDSSGYSVVLSNSDNTKQKTIINPTIYAYCFNNSYIAIMQTDNIEAKDSINYFLIDTENTIDYGPITDKQEFDRLLKSTVNPNNPLCGWIYLY